MTSTCINRKRKHRDAIHAEIPPKQKKGEGEGEGNDTDKVRRKNKKTNDRFCHDSQQKWKREKKEKKGQRKKIEQT
mgnify:CR=1 FL=1